MSLDPSLLKSLLKTNPRLKPCTPRQVEIWRLLSLGATVIEVAKELDLSTKTIETHIANIKDRTGCRNLSDLTRAAIIAGLIKPSDSI
jgi:hypothetical protein